MDEYTKKAVELVKRAGWARTSMLMRQLRITYPRAARIMDELIDAGVVDSKRHNDGKHMLINDDNLRGGDPSTSLGQAAALSESR